MKFVALLSGGKDSCFNLLESVANDHEPVAVAGLLPEQGIGQSRLPPISIQLIQPFSPTPNRRSTDELDSFMFQTVGLSLLPLIARSLRLPLYTRTITGKPINVESEYGDRRGLADMPQSEQQVQGVAGDETEDLFELLSTVKVSFIYPKSRDDVVQAQY